MYRHPFCAAGTCARSLTALSWALLLLGAAPARAQTAHGPDSAGHSRAVSALFADWVDSTTPGCAVGVNRRGQNVYRGAFGMANLETATPITLNTVFQAASLAKQITAMSVMLLVRDGKLSLDDDIRKFIPDLPDYGSRITVRHLLTHTSGLRDFFEMLILARGRFEEDRITHSDMMDMIVRQKALNFRPGDEFLYSNTGYALLEVIVSRTAGKSLRDFAAERIFTPLGMTHTQFKEDYFALVPGRASGYGRRGSGWRSSTPNYDVYGSTNLFTTVEDLLIWTANLDNPRVGDTAIVRQMSTRAVLNNGDRTDYGFGLSLWDNHGTTVIEHDGGDPGFRSYLGRYMQDSVAVAILCNAPSDPVSLGHQIADIYRGPIQLASSTSSSSPPILTDPNIVERRVGIYFQPTTLEVVELTARDGKLYTRRRGGRELQPIDANRFRVAGREIEHDFGPGPNSGYVARSLTPGRHPVTFEWKAPVTLTPAMLAQYAGDYFSEELNTVYRVSVADSTLVLRTGTTEGMTARPVFADTFVSGQITIQFIRSSKSVSGFEISHPRARRLSFVRKPKSSSLSTP